MLAPREAHGYLVGIALSAITFVALLLSPWNAGAAMLLIRLPPVIISAYIGGLKPGLLTSVLCLLGAAHSMMPLDDYQGREPPDPLRLLTFAGVAVAISILTEALHRARIDIELKSTLFMKSFTKSPVASSISRISDRKMVEVNDAYTTAFGLTREQLVGSTATAAGILVSDPRREALLAMLLERGEIRDLELELMDAAGSPRTVLLSCQVIEIGGEPHVLAMLLDVTARKQAEEAWRLSEGRFRELAETITEVFWMTDPAKHAMIYISPAYEKVWGRKLDELMAAPRTWLDAVHADDRARVGAWSLSQAGSGGGPYAEHYRILRPDGEVRWIHDQAFPVRDAAGQVIRIAGIAQDVTEQRALADQLRQTQKLESIGLLAGGVAHDFNNVLGAIAANSELIADSLAPGDPNRELTADIDAAVSRAAGMTRQLLAFSRKQVSEPIVIDVNLLVEDARRMLRRMVGEDMIVRVSLDPELERIRCDSSQFVQVLMNLAINARDAMHRGGTLQIETRQDGRWVLLTVSDDGCGMTDHVQARLFEPFFTTKEVGRGSGLGLPVVHGIVQQAGGLIEFDSKPGVGTTFRLRFPAVADLADVGLDPVAASTHGTERILMVDDDGHLRSAAARALRARGYTVLEASDGRTALHLLEDQRQPVELMITDVVMPGLDGRELAELAQARLPGLQVLFVSGYTEDEVVRRGIQQASLAFLEKPFRIHALAVKVRQLLDDARSAPGHLPAADPTSRLRIRPASS